MKDLALFFGDEPLGKVRVENVRGKEVFSFTYNEGWLKNRSLPRIDPDIMPFPGEQFPLGKEVFGFLGDIAPDRWGRRLIRRKEAQLARREGRPERPLLASDFIVGAYDLTRTGAVRVMLDGKFVSSDSSKPAPPWTTIRTLEECARKIDADEDGQDERWIEMLLAPGSSLGGARPKANVTDERGALWIAKFPSASDEWDVGAWEFFVSRLAKGAGLGMSDSRLERLSNAGSTFFSRRFDRDGGRRIHYASAMAMSGAADGEEGHSYLDVAEFLVREGARPDEDLSELWARIVFSRLVGNSDDHLRNHGFVMTGGGWRLSPMFDVNPNPDAAFAALDLLPGVPGASRAELIEGAEYFHLNQRTAEKRYAEILSAVSGWRQLAEKQHIRRSEIERMAGCFCKAEYL